jgi:hypothetical protein
LARAASVLLAAAAVITAFAGLWWRTTYLLAIAIIVWVELGRKRSTTGSTDGVRSSLNTFSGCGRKMY